MSIEIIPIIKSLGYLGVWGILFAESGLIFFFFLPGDSLLFTAGFLASQEFLNIWILSIGGFFAAIIGNIVGYAVGKYIGMKLFNLRPDHIISRVLKRKHLEMTQRFYARHGAMAVISARFMPIIRTFVPFLAGLVQMDYRKYLSYSVVGAALWVFGLTFFGYFFGRMLPPDQVDKYLLPIILGIIILSFVPSVIHILKDRAEAKAGQKN